MNHPGQNLLIKGVKLTGPAICKRPGGIAKGHTCYTTPLKNQKKRLKSPVFSSNAMKYQLP
jgi:hypothetical protein